MNTDQNKEMIEEKRKMLEEEAQKNKEASSQKKNKLGYMEICRALCMPNY